MPLTTVYPASTTNEAGFPANSGAAHDVLSDGSDGSWCSKQDYTTGNNYAYADAAAGAVGDLPGTAASVNSVQAIARAKAIGGNPSGNSGFTLQGGVRIGGVNYDAFGQDVKQLDDPDGVVQEFNGTLWVNNPATAIAWTVADVNGMGWWAGAKNYHFDGDVAYVLQLRFVVDYNGGAGGAARGSGGIIVGSLISLLVLPGGLLVRL